MWFSSVPGPPGVLQDRESGSPPLYFFPLTTWILAGEKPREFACPLEAGGGSASGQSPRPPGMAVWGNWKESGANGQAPPHFQGAPLSSSDGPPVGPGAPWQPRRRTRVEPLDQPQCGHKWSESNDGNEKTIRVGGAIHTAGSPMLCSLPSRSWTTPGNRHGGQLFALIEQHNTWWKWRTRILWEKKDPEHVESLPKEISVQNPISGQPIAIT